MDQVCRNCFWCAHYKGEGVGVCLRDESRMPGRRPRDRQCDTQYFLPIATGKALYAPPKVATKSKYENWNARGADVE